MELIKHIYCMKSTGLLYFPLQIYKTTHSAYRTCTKCANMLRLTRDPGPRWLPGLQTAAAAGWPQSPPCADLSSPCEPAGGS